MAGKPWARTREIEASLKRCRLGCGALLWPREVAAHVCDKPTIRDLAASRPGSMEPM